MREIILKFFKNPEIKNWQLFLLLTLFNILIIMVSDFFLMTKDTYRILLSSSLESYQIDNLYILMRHYSIYNYLLVPVILIIRALIVTMLIQFFFLFKRQNLKFGEILRISLSGLFILSTGSLVKVLWLMSMAKEQLTQELMIIMPLSLAEVINIDHLNQLMLGVINNFNIFELIWLLFISYLFKVVFDSGIAKSLLISFAVWAMIFLFQLGYALYITVLHG